jgi:NADH-quinone oxidoreductase subunit M
LLASLLLKLGSYGFIRFTFAICPLATKFYLPFIYTCCIVGAIYTSLTALRQIDFKRLIAYASISHMSIILLGIFSFQIYSIQGSILLNIGHGLVASGLFILVGLLYDRYQNRNLYYYGGLTHTMPLFSIFFLFFSMANSGFPGTSNFIGEILIFLGIFQKNTFLSIFACSTMFLSASYSI